MSHLSPSLRLLPLPSPPKSGGQEDDVAKPSTEGTVLTKNKRKNKRRRKQKEKKKSKKMTVTMVAENDRGPSKTSPWRLVCQGNDPRNRMVEGGVELAGVFPLPRTGASALVLDPLWPPRRRVQNRVGKAGIAARQPQQTQQQQEAGVDHRAVSPK